MYKTDWLNAVNQSNTAYYITETRMLLIFHSKREISYKQHSYMMKSYLAKNIIL